MDRRKERGRGRRDVTSGACNMTPYWCCLSSCSLKWFLFVPVLQLCPSLFFLNNEFAIRNKNQSLVKKKNPYFLSEGKTGQLHERLAGLEDALSVVPPSPSPLPFQSWHVTGSLTFWLGICCSLGLKCPTLIQIIPRCPWRFRLDSFSELSLPLSPRQPLW